MSSDSFNSPPAGEVPHPITRLGREDLDIVCGLVLKSGSLKGLAESYGVSYPTIRARLDRVIARLEGILAGRPADPMSDLLASLIERGEITHAGARQIRDLYRQFLAAGPAPASSTDTGGR
jgi:hypothetical protein